LDVATIVKQQSAIVTQAIYNVNKQTGSTFYVMTQQREYDDEVIKRGKQSIVVKEMKPLLMVLKT
jgi:hypothetical protein